MPKRTIKNKTIEVILLQHDRYLGEKYEVVKVKPSYARNVLFPKNIAVFSSEMMLNQYKQKMKTAEQDRVNKAKWLEDLFMKMLEDWGLNISKKTNKEWWLYEKVDENDIVKMISEKYGIAVDSHLFKLKKKIWTVWSFKVPFLYKEIKKELVLNVLAEKTEKWAKEEKAEVDEEKVTVKKSEINKATTEEKTEKVKVAKTTKKKAE